MAVPTNSVMCYSGHSYAQRPSSFCWQGQQLIVDSIICEAHTPQGKKFSVQTSDGLWFNLAYYAELDQWQVSPAYLPESSTKC